MTFKELQIRKKLGMFMGLKVVPDTDLTDGRLLSKLMSHGRLTTYVKHDGGHRFETVHHITGEIVVGQSGTDLGPALEQFLDRWQIQEDLVKTRTNHPSGKKRRQPA